MKMLVFVFMCLTTLANAQAFPEASIKGIFAKNSFFLSETNLQDVFALQKDVFLKEINVTTRMGREWRIKYSLILPQQYSGPGNLIAPLLFGGISFGPKDTQSGQSAEKKPVFLDMEFYSQRVELEMLAQMPTICQPKIFGEWQVAKLKLKGKPESGEEITVSDNFNRFLFGLGVTGYERQRNLMVKYEVAHTFSDRGWFVDLGGRYDGRMGFVDAGWRYRKSLVKELRTEWNGPYVGLGINF